MVPKLLIDVTFVINLNHLLQSWPSGSKKYKKMYGGKEFEILGEGEKTTKKTKLKRRIPRI